YLSVFVPAVHPRPHHINPIYDHSTSATPTPSSQTNSHPPPSRPHPTTRFGPLTPARPAPRTDKTAGRTAGPGSLLGQLAPHRLLQAAPGCARLSHGPDLQDSTAKRTLFGP